MNTPPIPEFRTSPTILLAGIMANDGSQAEATKKIPEHWRKFL
jgi:hypothetical protein